MKAAAVLRLVLHHTLTHCWKGTEKNTVPESAQQPGKRQECEMLRSVEVRELDPTSRAKKLGGLQKVGWPRDV